MDTLAPGSTGPYVKLITYRIAEWNIRALQQRYPFLEVGTAGESVSGRSMPYVRLGTGSRRLFYNGAHHGLEWITAVLLLKFIEDFSLAYATGSTLRGYDVAEIWCRSSIYILPMVNPDGVDLVVEGLHTDNPYYQDLLHWNETGLPFGKVWQANIRGVDLNRNYPAGWDKAKAMEPALGVHGPGPTRYGGPSPLSEPETTAMVDFTRRHSFDLVVAYHAQGKEIYWQYENIAPPEALRIAQLLAGASGYTVAAPVPEATYAGYKDWFIQEYRRPGYTIEVGLGENPLPISQFDTIYHDNLGALLLAAAMW